MDTLTLWNLLGITLLVAGLATLPWLWRLPDPTRMLAVASTIVMATALGVAHAGI
ncbi:hypothetical protein [Nocardia sp. IFM 10818]